MKKTEEIKMIAENIENMSGFDIYLDFSGEYEYLTSHRHNGKLYNLLKDGMPLDEIRTIRPSELWNCSGHISGNKSVQHLQDTLDYLIRKADRYISERSA